MTRLTLAAIAAIGLSTPALAGGHSQSPDAVKGMTSALKGGGGGNNSALKDGLGLEGKGGVASFVSGGGNGGWGNVGSNLTGGRVSNRPAPDDE